MNIVRQHQATLLEVMIAMVLTTLVITTLTFFYQQVTMVGIEIDKIKKEHFYFRYLENRLADTLPKTLDKSNENEFVFFSVDSDSVSKGGSQSLIFAFDNGISLDNNFSNEVIARLFVSPKGTLTLAYWPSRKQWDKADRPMKKEILLEGVDTMRLAFFIAPEKKEVAPSEEKKNDGKKGKNEPPKPPENPKEEKPSPEPKGAWSEKPWLSEYESLPVMVQITIKMEGSDEERRFVFPLVNGESHIQYD